MDFNECYTRGNSHLGQTLKWSDKKLLSVRNSCFVGATSISNWDVSFSFGDYCIIGWSNDRRFEKILERE